MASPRAVGFVGLDEFSAEMAALLVKSGFHVKAFEAAQSAWWKAFLAVGGSRCDDIKEAGKDVAALIVTSINHVDDELVFGDQGIANWPCEGAAIIVRSTISHGYTEKLEKLVNENMVIVGVHVFNGVSGAFDGKIMIAAFGNLEATKKAGPVLAAMSEKLYVLDGEIGARSKVRMVNELIKTIHFAASLEAIFLGASAGIHPWILYDIISNAAGSSW